MDRQVRGIDNPTGRLRSACPARPALTAGYWLAAALVFATTAAAADPEPTEIDLFQKPALHADLAGLEHLVETGQYRLAEHALRARLRQFRSVAGYHYILAATLAATGRSDAALESLENAVRLGFSGDGGSLLGDFSDLLKNPRYAGLTRRIAANRAKVQSRTPGGSPGPVEQQTAIVSRNNTDWDPQAKVLRVAFRFDDAGPGEGVVPVGTGDAGEEPSLNRLYAIGQAAGNHGDLYDNRDRDHSTLTRSEFPQLAFVEYVEDARKARVHYGLNPGLRFNAVTVGNSSMAVTGGLFWRSLPRLALTTREGPHRLFEEYSGNHLYIYPGHRDHDADHGDLYPANTPYMLISQGSSGSDKPFLRAVVSILAAFNPAVKDFLKRNNLIMPTVQMIFRRGLKSVSSDEDYLSGTAHPTVFSAAEIDLPAMIERAASLDVLGIPPMVRLAVVEETAVRPEIDFFGGGSLRLFDTPGAIARLGRSTAASHRMRISAEDTEDPNGRDLIFHWIVLRGDKDRIRIAPLNGTASVVDLEIPWHDRRLVPGTEKLASNRVDIGVFAHNGMHYSAPAFISFFFPANQWREYDRSGRIRLVDYQRSPLNKRYADPALFPLRDWSDRYHYDGAGRLIGWTRNRAGGSTQFTRHGARVIEVDSFGRALRAAVVRYDLERRAGGLNHVIEATTGEELRYSYRSRTDRYGRLVNPE